MQESLIIIFENVLFCLVFPFRFLLQSIGTASRFQLFRVILMSWIQLFFVFLQQLMEEDQE